MVALNAFLMHVIKQHIFTGIVGWKFAGEKRPHNKNPVSNSHIGWMGVLQIADTVVHHCTDAPAYLCDSLEGQHARISTNLLKILQTARSHRDQMPAIRSRPRINVMSMPSTTSILIVCINSQLSRTAYYAYTLRTHSALQSCVHQTPMSQATSRKFSPANCTSSTTHNGSFISAVLNN